MHHSIRDEFDFTAGISGYLLMTEQEAQTDWHQNFTGTSVFYFLLKTGKEFFFVEPTKKAQQRSDECMEKVCEIENSVTSFQPILKSVIFFRIVRLLVR